MTVGKTRKVYVVLGLYRPDPKLFARQLKSVLDQTHTELKLIVATDGPPGQEARDVLDAYSDPRVHLEAFPERVGVHANFARGLRLALARSGAGEDLFAFCDQDDLWLPEKLERQVAVFDTAEIALCHSDARLVRPDGHELATSMFAFEARSEQMGFQDLLIMNSVTGMTSVFRKDAAEAAAVFPMSGTPHILHDHWVALVASSMGRIEFIAEPLVDYVQHGTNELGATPPAKVGPFRNLLLGGRAYRERCRQQFAWRAQALQELKDRRFPNFDGTVLDRNRLLGFALKSLSAGRRRQAEQAWRLFLGRTL